MKNLALTALAVVAPGVVWAHPEHAVDSTAGLAHLVTDPFHLSLIALAIALATGVRLVTRRLRRAPSRS